jgi:hypothetical protein
MTAERRHRREVEGRGRGRVGRVQQPEHRLVEEQRGEEAGDEGLDVRHVTPLMSTLP